MLQNAIVPIPKEHPAHQDGLVGIGGALSPELLKKAYQHGLFPWFNEEDPPLWWSPNPRTLFSPEHFHLSRSLKKTLRQRLTGKSPPYFITTNQSFQEVMQRCAGRNEGSWIHQTIIQNYCTLFEQGFAFSLELRRHDEPDKLFGGFYGVHLGKMLFGESMFSNVNDASKMLLAVLLKWMKNNDYPLLDAQVISPHLSSLGATTMPRHQFEQQLESLIPTITPHQSLPNTLSWHE